MKKYVCLMLLLLLAAALTGCQRLPEEDDTPIEELTLESGVLKVGMNMQTVPMEYVTEEEAKPAGFDVEMAYILGANLGMEIEFIDISEENLLTSLDAQIVDCVISSIKLTQENQKKYFATTPYLDGSIIAEQVAGKDVDGELAIFVGRDNGQLMLRLDDAVEIILNNGQLDKLIEECFPPGESLSIF